ncbi:MAG: GNAT family N-acetyltransferase [Pseudonocardiales bacterium]|nr:GNAT family N-acetyltransferase [Pseudonocardiales bacterium]
MLPEWAVIRVLGVDPALRGRGVARALIENCVTWPGRIARPQWACIPRTCIPRR